jgi:molybdenum cofactor cytidylyltransferase
VASSAAGVVLAAGSSSRLGRNKLLLEIGGETLARRAVRTAVEGGLDPVYVVVGHEEQKVLASLRGLSFHPVPNPEHEKGAATSLKAGVRAAHASPALVILLADMPLTTPAMVAALVARWRSGGVALVLSRYGGDVEAPPNLFDRVLYPELLDEADEKAGKAVARRFRAEAALLEWPKELLADVDAPGDVDAVRALFEARA